MAGAALGMVLSFVLVSGAGLPFLSEPLVRSTDCSAEVLSCDSDADGIANVVEETICGSATCATGDEDVDGDGISDATELAESLEHGGTAGPLRFRGDFGTVEVVLPGNTIVDVLWWPLPVALLGVLAAFVLLRVRSKSRREQAGHIGQSVKEEQ